ncbi:MAG: response regulator [Clostridium sp.]
MIRIMIVEDDPMVREINIRFVEKIGGFDVIGEADSIVKAKDILENEEVDLVLLDVFLPDGNGIDLLKWTREKQINTDVILITAEKSTGAVEEALKFGAFDYLIKPFQFNRFSEALRGYKEKVDLFANVNSFSQNSLDEFILKMKNQPPQEDELKYQKGVNINTYNKIIDFIKKANGSKMTAEDVADGIGLSRVTVRRYLEKMSEGGVLEIEQAYGKIGRPTNFYYMK